MWWFLPHFHINSSFHHKRKWGEWAVKSYTHMSESWLCSTGHSPRSENQATSYLLSSSPPCLAVCRTFRTQGGDWINVNTNSQRTWLLYENWAENWMIACCCWPYTTTHSRTLKASYKQVWGAFVLDKLILSIIKEPLHGVVLYTVTLPHLGTAAGIVELIISIFRLINFNCAIFMVHLHMHSYLWCRFFPSEGVKW